MRGVCVCVCAVLRAGVCFVSLFRLSGSGASALRLTVLEPDHDGSRGRGGEAAPRRPGSEVRRRDALARLRVHAASTTAGD
jgi:hypothetical protein